MRAGLARLQVPFSVPRTRQINNNGREREELNIKNLFSTGKLGYASGNDLEEYEITYIGFLDR